MNAQHLAHLTTPPVQDWTRDWHNIVYPSRANLFWQREHLAEITANAPDLLALIPAHDVVFATPPNLALPGDIALQSVAPDGYELVAGPQGNNPWLPGGLLDLRAHHFLPS